MILYLDTSSLVKLYVEEIGSNEVKKLVKAAQIVSTSRIAYVEARAGFARKLREGELDRTGWEQIVKDLEIDWKRYFIMEVSETLTKLAVVLADKYPLRGFDAIHLASGLLLKRKTKLDVRFSCFDKKLKEAAQSEGLFI